MNSLEFQIFNSNAEIKAFPYNLIIFIIWIFALSFFWLAEKHLPSTPFLSYFKITYLICAVLISIYWLISGLWSYQKLNGNLHGVLTFENDKFYVNEEKVVLEEIKKLDIFGGDYYGRQTRGVAIDFNPSLSQGVNNYIEFECFNGSTKKVYFKQIRENQYRELQAFIVTGADLGKLSILRATELLGINYYSEIQKFKKKRHFNSGHQEIKANPFSEKLTLTQNVAMDIRFVMRQKVGVC